MVQLRNCFQTSISVASINEKIKAIERLEKKEDNHLQVDQIFA